MWSDHELSTKQPRSQGLFPGLGAHKLGKRPWERGWAQSRKKFIAPDQSWNLRFLSFLVTDRHRGNLHEGDIKLTHAQRQMLAIPVQRDKGGRQKRAAMKSLTRRWMESNGQPVIPYRIEGSVGECATYPLKRFTTGPAPQTRSVSLSLSLTAKQSVILTRQAVYHCYKCMPGEIWVTVLCYCPLYGRCQSQNVKTG